MEIQERMEKDNYEWFFEEIKNLMKGRSNVLSKFSIQELIDKVEIPESLTDRCKCGHERRWHDKGNGRCLFDEEEDILCDCQEFKNEE